MAKKKRTIQTMKAVVLSSRTAVQRISVDQLAGIPEEEIWLASRKSLTFPYRDVSKYGG
jgi:hypothetical protein